MSAILPFALDLVAQNIMQVMVTVIQCHRATHITTAVARVVVIMVQREC